MQTSGLRFTEFRGTRHHAAARCHMELAFYDKGLHLLAQVDRPMPTKPWAMVRIAATRGYGYRHAVHGLHHLTVATQGSSTDIGRYGKSSINGAHAHGDTAQRP